MSEQSNNAQRMMTFFGCDRKFSDTPRGKLLAHIVYLRALRSWITPGAYAWFRFNDDIRNAQKHLAAIRYPVVSEPLEVENLP